MGNLVELLSEERRARVFFAALAQSALGTGAGYVALLLLAYERLSSAWAISLVLLADLAPAMLLGPLLGAVADRWSRRTCAVAADVVRAGAFAGIALVDSFPATLGLAALAGAGTALFTPAALAALPGLVRQPRLPAATALYGALADVGYTAGPALAALLLLAGGPEEIMLLNAATFALSAVALARLRFGQAPRAAGSARRTGALSSLLAETRAGLRAAVRLSRIRVVLLASAAALFFGGVFNVGELPFATGALDAGEVGYSVLIAVLGAGFAVGSLAGSGGGSRATLERRYLAGIALMGLGFALAGLAPSLLVALVPFALGGFGNGVLLVYERLLIQTAVPDGLRGRLFGVRDALTAWAFGLAFLAGGAAFELAGARGLLVASGVGAVVVAALGAVALGRSPGLGGRMHAAGDAAGRQHRADLADGDERGLARL